MTVESKYPVLIQAGMGIGISNWRLANAVARLGHLGVVSGTTMDSLLVRRLQSGDPEGHMRRALDRFPVPEIANKIIKKYFRPEGLKPHEPFAMLPLLSANLSQDQQELLVAANFVEVFLAKEGHKGKVGINFLEKIQIPILPSIFGAMLADVDYVLMGAGIPKDIPGVLDELAKMQDVDYKLFVAQAGSDDHFKIHFSPKNIMNGTTLNLKRPEFLAIISSSTLALTLAKKSSGKVNGFVIEAPSAGGHNAPPRGKLQLTEKGEPLYGPRDEVDLKVIKDLGLPFWLAGSQGSKEHLKSARELGAQGVQVGTAFALCEESGLDERLKEQLIKQALQGEAQVFTDPAASPTGFPFKVALLDKTLSQSTDYAQRTRVCDLGYLREPYKKTDGSLGYRCASEPIETYMSKGGERENTNGRKCLCNGLMANIGLGQKRKTGVEKPLVTIGDDVNQVTQFMKPGNFYYKAADVVQELTSSLHS